MLDRRDRGTKRLGGLELSIQSRRRDISLSLSLSPPHARASSFIIGLRGLRGCNLASLSLLRFEKLIRQFEKAILTNRRSCSFDQSLFFRRLSLPTQLSVKLCLENYRDRSDSATNSAR